MTSSSDPSKTDAARLCALVLAVLLTAAGPPAPGPTTLVAVQERYDGIRDVRASFVQTSHVAALGREQVSRGHVVVQRPGRMRWEYTEPEPSVIVIDAEAVRMYLPAEKKLQIAPLRAGVVSPTALGFLLGTGRLAETFEAQELPAGAASAGEPQVGWKLRPRQDAGFESLELWVDSSRRLRESVLVDLFGNRTRVRFDHLVENSGVEEAAFTITVPDDTDVVDLR